MKQALQSLKHVFVKELDGLSTPSEDVVDDEVVFAGVRGLGTFHEVDGVGRDGCVVGREAKVLGGKLVDYWVDLYDCGSDTMGDEGGRGGTNS